MGNIIFDGYNFEDYGVVVSGSGTWNMPERRTVKDTIPGKHGALITDAGEFENVEIPYPAWIARGFAEKYEEFSRMLALHTDKYYRLEDSYHTDYYRMARVVPGITPKTGTLNRSGEFTITFDCKPQKWLRSGEEPISIDGNFTIFNPTGFDAKPIITAPPKTQVLIWNYADGSPSILNFFEVEHFEELYITYDADTEEAMDEYGVCANMYVGQERSIFLRPGRTNISTNKPIKLIPRFFAI
jgi:phage-related protein